MREIQITLLSVKVQNRERTLKVLVKELERKSGSLYWQGSLQYGTNVEDCPQMRM